MRAALARLLHRMRRPIVEEVVRRDDALRLMIGRHESRSVRTTRPPLPDAEFSVFSQFGEDGIVTLLVHVVPIVERRFVEIGVQDYLESNTRFLLHNDGWDGLIVDSGTDHLAYAARPEVRWRHELHAVSEFVTAENINEILSRHGYIGDLGLLSLDIDGNDFWVLRSMTAARPRIVVAEYNSIFGPHRAVSVPYDPSFERSRGHWSWLWFGASIGALSVWASEAGYDLVGSNRAGNNAFFVRSDVNPGLPVLSPAEAWQRSRFRESRNPEGEHSFVEPHSEGVRLIAGQPLIDVQSGGATTVAEALGLGR